jgi:hypothetical protein
MRAIVGQGLMFAGRASDERLENAQDTSSRIRSVGDAKLMLCRSLIKTVGEQRANAVMQAIEIKGVIRFSTIFRSFQHLRRLAKADRIQTVAANGLAGSDD